MGSQTAHPRRDAVRKVGRLRDPAWILVGVVAALVKAEALTELLHHRGLLIVCLGLGLVTSVLRTQPAGAALLAGPLIALALAPSSTALGIALAIGTDGMLLALFFAIGTVLMAFQDPGQPRAGDDLPHRCPAR